MVNRNYTVIPTETFLKELEKLSNIDKDRVLDTIEDIKKNPFYPSLQSHKVLGVKKRFESYVNMDIRIIWRFGESNTIILTDVGHHDVLKKY